MTIFFCVWEGLDNSELKENILIRDNERLRMIYCQYQTKCESQRVCLAAYKVIHMSCSQKAKKSVSQA